MAHKIAVVGDKDSVFLSKFFGFDVFPAHESLEARETIDRLASEDYGIIYVTEAVASEIAETIRRYDTVVSPAIILIPNHKGSLAIGKSRIQENVEKAVGQNIL